MWEIILETVRRMHWAEVTSVIAGVIYVVLAARQNIWCWLFGIIGSAFSIYLFYFSKLYAESFLYLYYVAAGIYGWWAWTHARDAEGGRQMSITTWHWWQHLLTLVIGGGTSLLLAWLLERYTDAQLPLLDAHTTIFSFIATYLVTRKVLSNWVYWIVIDTVSIGLYASRELYLYALLMVAYTLIAAWGYRKWRRAYRAEKKGEKDWPPLPANRSN